MNLFNSFKFKIIGIWLFTKNSCQPLCWTIESKEDNGMRYSWKGKKEQDHARPYMKERDRGDE